MYFKSQQGENKESRPVVYSALCEVDKKKIVLNFEGHEVDKKCQISDNKVFIKY